MNKSWRKIFYIFAVLILAAVFLQLLFSEALFRYLASNLLTEDKLSRSDAIAVLGGGTPSRVLEAVDLQKEGYSEFIILTRGGKPEGLDYLNSLGIDFPEEVKINKFIANSLGIKDNNLILLDSRVYSTKEEAELIKDLAESKGFNSLIVTTSPTHSRRSEIIFEDVFEGSEIEILIRPTKYDSFDPDELEKNSSHWKQVILEYQKILYYYGDGII